MAVEEVIIRAVDQFSATAKNIEQSTKSLMGGFTALAGAASLGAVAVGVKKCVEAYAEQEKVQTQLAFSLRAVGVTAKSVSADYIEFANQLSKTSMFQDEQIVQVETLFTQYGLYGEQLKRATRASIDFATATGKDLQSAAMLFAKASEGSTKALGLYGLKVKDADLATKGLAAVFEASEAKFKGFGEAALDTAAGRANQLGKSFEDATKAVGMFFDSLDRKLGVTKATAGLFNQLADGLNTLQDPTVQIYKQMRELNDEIARLKSVGKDTGLADAFRKLTFQDTVAGEIEKKTAALKKLEDQLKSNQATMAAGAVTPEKQNDNAQRLALEKYQKDYNKIQDEIVGKSAWGNDKIEQEKKASLDKILAFEREHSGKTKDTIALRVAAEQKALKDTIELNANRVSAGMNAVTALAKGNISGFVSSISSMLPPHMQAIVGAAQSAVTAVSTIFEAFATQTKSSTQAMIDTIERVSVEVDKAFKRLKEYQDEASKIQTGKVKEFSGYTDPFQGRDKKGAEDAAKKQLEEMGLGGFVLPHGYGAAARVFSKVRVEKNDNGDVVFYSSDINEELGFYDSKSGKIKVEGTPYDLSEDFIGKGLRYIYEQFRAGKLASPADTSKGYATGGIVSGYGTGDTVSARLTPGEFVVSKKGVNAQTLGLLKRLNSGSTSGANQIVINVSAIDENGVSKFLKEKLAPMMRELSGRENLVFLNSRGVSANA